MSTPDANKNSHAPSNEQPKPSQEPDKSIDAERPKKWTELARNHLESPFIQIVVLLLVYFDILLGATQTAADTNDARSYHFELLRVIILYIHAIELASQMIIFRSRFFNHWGFLFDTLLIGNRLLQRHTTFVAVSQHSHLTGFLRVWRLLRLVETYLSIETKSHIATKRELSRQIRAIEEYKNNLKEERDLRKQNEAAAKGWQEEIETLREALKIAAESVALVGLGNSDEVELEEIVALGPPAPVEEAEEEVNESTIRSISPVME